MSMPSSERRRGDQRAQASGLQEVFDLGALRAGQRAVVRAHQRLAGQFVQRAGEPLGESAAVHEQQRRAMGADELEQAWMDRGPDRLHRLRRGRPAHRLGAVAHGGHVRDRHVNGDGERLRGARVDEGHRPRRRRCVERELGVQRVVGRLHRAPGRAGPWTSGRVAAEEERDLVEVALRGRQSDALSGTAGDRGEALE
ncbi:MAG: hypothetical protein U0P30_18030 [Vicinamibacterales bacterium]